MHEFQTRQRRGFTDRFQVVLEFAFQLRQLVLQHVVGFDEAFLRPRDVAFPFYVGVELRQVLSHRRKQTLFALLFLAARLLRLSTRERQQLDQPTALEVCSVLAQSLQRVPTFVEVLYQLPELSQPRRTHVLEVDCFLSDGFDGIVV